MEKFLKRAACSILSLSLFLGISAAASGEELVPMGDVVGISVASRGAVVAGFEDGGGSPAETAGITKGDVIIAIGNREIKSAKEAAEALESKAGQNIAVTVLRGGEEKRVTLTAGDAGEGKGLLGVWLRDTLTGIGTVTYYDPETGQFGALGHGINDADSGKLLPFDGGTITGASVVDVVKGAPGAPGELCGQPDREQVLGELEKNTGCGIFGKAGFEDAGEPVPVASPQEVRLGPASILSTVGGDGVKEYSVEISRIYRQPDEHRFLMLTVTDPALLAQTGGIVQGMSGSPILQDGKLIGAVTHVLLSDATRGYGIGIREMLDAAA